MKVTNNDGEVNVRFGGLGIGTMSAMLVSYHLSGSIWWAIFHGIFGWFYILYKLIQGVI